MAGRRARLSRQDWIDAATRLGTRVGVENLAVEALAAELGATKGSFYWHFADRAELLDAVLAAWEREHTRAVIERVEAVGDDPEAALAALVLEVLGDPGSDAAEWRILLAADHPLVGPVVRRVHEVRIDYAARLLRARGLDADRAAARARITYAAYLGNLLLSRDPAGGSEVDAAALRAELLALVLAP